MNDTSDDGWRRPAPALLVGAALLAVLVIGFVDLPSGTRALPPIARHAMQIALPQWGTTEVVSEIVYGSRGWDTFGETFLLLAAVVSVVTLARRREHRNEYVGEASAGHVEQQRTDPPNDSEDSDPNESQARSAEQAEESGSAPRGGPADDPDDDPLGEPAPERAIAMTVIVRVASRTVAPILLVAGVYLAAWGYTPGGGFPAGAALTGVIVLLYAAFGHRAVGRAVRPSSLEPIEMAGAAAIVAIGVIGLALSGSFLANWVPLAEQQTIRAGGNLQLFSGAELVEVASGLTIAIFSLIGMAHDWTPDAPDPQ